MGFRRSQTNARRFRSLHAENAPSIASRVCELLEHRQLMSATNNSVLSQTISVSPTVAGSGGDGFIRIEEVRQVGGEIHLLSRVHQNQYSAAGTTEVQDSVTVMAPSLPVRYFQVGGAGLANGDPSVTQVESISGFHKQVAGQSSQILFSRVDSNLMEWRNNIETEIIERADQAYKDQFGTTASNYWWNVRPMVGMNFSVFAADSAQAGVMSLQVSNTNVQVQGVDEADIVETDGQFLYTISQNEIVVIRAATATAEAAVVSRMQLTDTPVAMFLQGSRLTVISSRNTYTPFFDLMTGAMFRPFSSSTQQTVVSVLDIVDKTAPALVQETIVDGIYQAARAVGDQVYLVVNNNATAYVPGLGMIWQPGPTPVVSSIDPINNITIDNMTIGSTAALRIAAPSQYRYQTRNEYLQSVADLVYGTQFNDGLAPPSVWRRAAEGETGLQSLGWLDGNTDEFPMDGGQTTTVLQFDAKESNPGPVSNLTTTSRAYGGVTVYSTEDSMYLVMQESTSTQDSATGAFIYSTGSRIHKIGLTENGLVAEGEGFVKGYVHDQFSLDEHNGFLRIVTTDSWFASTNELYVLEDQGDTLNVVGSIEGIAPTERIYSSRFDGDRGWVVTFRQVDPIFSFDLSDPRNPHITGELKIPGFSDYMQLIDENHLLAIGRNATAEGRVREVQVSLFDISDMANPALLHRYSLDSVTYGYSVASSDHLAFNYMPAIGTLAIPFGQWAQQRIVLLSVDFQKGINQIGVVGGLAANPNVVGWDAWWSQTDSFLRSVQIDDSLYAISQKSIHIVDLDDPNTLVQQLTLQDTTVRSAALAGLTPMTTKKLSDAVRVRNRQTPSGAATGLQLHFDDVLAGVSLDNIAEFEFRIRNADKTVLMTVGSETPDVILTTAQQRQLGTGTYLVEVRTRSSRLANAVFGQWSTGESFSVVASTPTMLSSSTLTMADRKLQWSHVSDRVTEAIRAIPEKLNRVTGYDLQITDAKTGKRIQFDRNINATETDLNLPAGRYKAWLRAIYEIGVPGKWSAAESFSILGEKVVVNDLTTTTNLAPTISWQPVADAVTFQIEVTQPNGTTPVYSAENLNSTSHKPGRNLPLGTYSIRVRGQLSSGVATEWSDPKTVTIVGRPDILVAGSGFSWNATGAMRTEVWINTSGTSNRVFHSTTATGSSVSNVVSDLGLSSGAVYDVWVRNILPDGSMTSWSAKSILKTSIADKVQVHSMAPLAVGEALTISWESATGANSYEVYVARNGQFLLRQAGIRDTQFTLPGAAIAGNYQIWVRAVGSGDLKSNWGDRMNVVVQQTPSLSMSDSGLLSWTSLPATSQYELWINEVDAHGYQVQSGLVHLSNLTTRTFNLSEFSGRHLKIWVRGVQKTNEHLTYSPWSIKSVTAPAGATASGFSFAHSFERVIDGVLAEL